MIDRGRGNYWGSFVPLGNDFVYSIEGNFACLHWAYFFLGKPQIGRVDYGCD